MTHLTRSSQRCEKVDQVAVWINDRGIPLPPEGIVGWGRHRMPGQHETLDDPVNLGRGLAQQPE